LHFVFCFQDRSVVGEYPDSSTAVNKITMSGKDVGHLANLYLDTRISQRICTGRQKMRHTATAGTFTNFIAGPLGGIVTAPMNQLSNP
jgi:hypothetical protein